MTGVSLSFRERAGAHVRQPGGVQPVERADDALPSQVQRVSVGRGDQVDPRLLEGERQFTGALAVGEEL